MKQPYTALSEKKCIDCKRLLKQNLINRKPDAQRCFNCHCKHTGKGKYRYQRKKEL